MNRKQIILITLPMVFLAACGQTLGQESFPDSETHGSGRYFRTNVENQVFQSGSYSSVIVGQKLPLPDEGQEEMLEV